jgi:hypothetical protein
MTEKTGPATTRENVAKSTHLKAKPKIAKRKAKLKLNGNGAAAAVPLLSTPDPFNLESLSLPQDFNSSGVKRARSTRCLFASPSVKNLSASIRRSAATLH